MLKRRNKKNAQQVMDNGGMMDEAGQVVNGTEVPVGSMAEEVADDVPAMLSEGEFVIPADVVRFVGLERLMKMRDKAKEGLERMEDVGQMGNAEEVSNPDQQFAQAGDIAFENDIDSIIGEVDKNGAAMQTEQMFAAGGYVSGGDVDKATRNPAVDVRYFKHSDGRVMYITFINDKPMTAIPQGFSQVSAEDARQVGRKAEVREEAKAETAASSGGGDGGGGRDTFDPMQPVKSGGVFGGGDGSKGYESGDVPGAGIDVNLQNLAFKGLAAAEHAKKVALVNPVLGALLYAGGKGSEMILDSQIDKATAAERAVAAPPALGGMGTFAARDGGISTISTKQMEDKFIMDTFGTTSDQINADRAAREQAEAAARAQAQAQYDAQVAAQRQAETERAEAAARAQAEAAARAQAQAQAEAAARAEAQRAYDAQVAAQRQAEADRARAAAAEAARRQAEADRAAAQRAAAEQQAREVANNPGGWSDSQRSEAAETGSMTVNGVNVSNDATIAAQNESFFGSDSNGGDGGGGKIICTKLYELGLMNKDVYKADQEYGLRVASKDPALMDGYHYWANVVVDWMSGSGVRVIPFISDARHEKLFSKWATLWAQEIATPWAEHMQYLMGGREKDSKIGKALMTVGAPISRLFAKKTAAPTVITAIGCIATFVTLYVFVKVAKLFVK